MGLLRCQGADSLQHGDIDGPGVKEKGSQHHLDKDGVFDVKEGCCVGRSGILDLGAVLWLCPCVWRWLVPCWLAVCESLQGAFHLARHGYRDVTFVLIPCEG